MSFDLTPNLVLFIFLTNFCLQLKWFNGSLGILSCIVVVFGPLKKFFSSQSAGFVLRLWGSPEKLKKKKLEISVNQ